MIKVNKQKLVVVYLCFKPFNMIFVVVVYISILSCTLCSLIYKNSYMECAAFLWMIFQ